MYFMTGDKQFMYINNLFLLQIICQINITHNIIQP